MNKTRQFHSVLSLIILVFLAVQGYSCVGNRKNGPIIKERRDVGSFSKIEVSNGIDVYLKLGSQISVEVETAASSMNELKTELKGNSLLISFDGAWGINRSANVYITMRDIELIKTSGGSDVVSEGVINSPKLSLKSSGGSDIRVEVDVEDLEIECSGGSDVTISGTAGKLKARTSGGSDIKGFDLLTDEADLESSGGSDIRVHVVEKLWAEASGGSDIRYRGNPEIISIKSSSSADIEKDGN